MIDIISTIILYVAGLVAIAVISFILWFIIDKAQITITTEDGYTNINITSGRKAQVAITKGQNSPAININK